MKNTMKKNIMAGLAAISLVSISSFAYAEPETYVVDNNHTFARFEYGHLGFSTQLGRFDKTSGSIILDRANKTGSVDINIDTSSVSTGVTALNEHLQGEDYFDTKKYPNATFKSDKITFEGSFPKVIDGNLTIKGITKPVSLLITSVKCMNHPMTKKDACGADAIAKIKRSDFNMAKYVPNVSDEVTLTLAIEASKP
ncbi:MAG: hypothetical protein RLZZ210_1571 [Pseudomonadota bacterium]|jgi:polyisoprenoid-binding protein YceI